MKSEIKQRWVEALRSEGYTQGFHQLRDFESRYDAVGVLCDLADKEGLVEVREFGEGREQPVFWGYTYDGASVRLPKAVEEWSGLGYWQANHILVMNDKGQSFDKIADYIEENL